jgi:hypothetical protein
MSELIGLYGIGVFHNIVLVGVGVGCKRIAYTPKAPQRMAERLRELLVSTDQFHDRDPFDVWISHAFVPKFLCGF